MEPNQNEPITSTPITPVNPLEPAIQQPQVYQNPIVEPAQQPVPVYAPQPISVTPQPVVAQPTMGPQPVASSTVFGSTPVTAAPQQTFAQPAINTAVYKPKNPKIKLFIIIGAVVASLLGIGIAVWLMFFNGMPLMTYSNDDFSILVPKDEAYKKEEIGSSVTFKKDGKDGDGDSSVTASVNETYGQSREDIIKLYERILTEDSLSSAFTGNEEIKDFKFEKLKKDGMDVISISAKAMKDNKYEGILKMKIFINDKKMYSVMVAAHNSESGLANSADKIIDSLKIK